MSRRYGYKPLTPRQLSELLKLAGLTKRAFSKISGADDRRVERWVSGEQPDPPMWVGPLLLAMSIPQARQMVMEYVDLVVRDVRRDNPDEEEGS
jgi:hypothetical protein